MNQPEAIDDPYLRGLNLLPLYPIQIPFMVGNSNGVPDCEVELLLREQERPPIDDLDETTRYHLGIGMRYIAYSLGAILRLSSDDALLVYASFVEAMMERMEHYRGGYRGAFGIDDFIDALLSVCGDRYAEIDLDIRATVKWYIQRILNQQPQIVGPPRPLDLEEACAELIGLVPAFHVSSQIYDQCERAKWGEIRNRGRLLPAGAFLMVIDGETWQQLESDPTKQAQTRWVLVDARERKMLLYESVDFRGMGVLPGANILMGATWDGPTGAHKPIESRTTFLPAADGCQPYVMDIFEAGRLNHAVASFLMLLRNERVNVKPHPAHGHWVVEIPVGASVNELIDEILDTSESA